MKEFLELFDKYKTDMKLSLEIKYTAVLDYYIQISQGNHNNYVELFVAQENDLNLCVAKAYIFLTKWLLENNSGY